MIDYNEYGYRLFKILCATLTHIVFTTHRETRTTHTSSSCIPVCVNAIATLLFSSLFFIFNPFS